jgi:hypothetical protein
MDVNTAMKLILFILVAACLLLIVKDTILGVTKPASTIVFTVVAFPFAERFAARKKGVMEPRTKLMIAVIGLLITMLLVFGLWKAFEGGLIKGAPELFANIFG